MPTTIGIRKKPTSSKKPSGASGEPDEESIRQRAYEIYLARGAAGGDPSADWEEAKRQLTAIPAQ